ncbi:MAG TPA: hypothetical protein PKC24_05185 [Cyclobacteriaceae bacterium]|nr:hypothetical protein [Cyclobacteriaceae bacterium]
MINPFSSGPQLLPEDGLQVTPAEPWFRLKQQVMLKYTAAYVKNMNYRVNELMLVDLYAGNGLHSIGSLQNRYADYDLSLLAGAFAFKKFCFCPVGSEDAKALRIRVNRWYKDNNVLILEGDRKDLIKRIKLYIPKSSGSFKVSTFCVVDAFSLKLDFVWFDLLADHNFDFMLVFTFPLNEVQNWKYYLTEEKQTISKFLGSWNGFEKLQRASTDNVSFYKKLFELHQQDMKLLGYDCLVHTHKLDSDLMRIPFYFTVCFTRSVSAKLMQKELGEFDQMDLFN